MFVHLRGRATYSMLEGIGSHDEILTTAQSYGQDALAITDLYGMFGVVDFYNKAKKYDIRPLIGVEMPYTADIHDLSPKRDIVKTLWTITLLAISQVWYHNLLKIVSWAYDQAIDELPCIDDTVLQWYTTDVIVLLWWLYSHIYQLVSSYDDLTGASIYIDTLVNLFGQKHVICDITAQPYTIYTDLSMTNDYLMKLSQDRDMLSVVTSGFQYPTLTHKHAYETALAIKDNKKIYDPDHRVVSGEHHLLSEKEVISILSSNGYASDMIERLIVTTHEIADRCQIKIELWQMLSPNYETPDDIRTLYDMHQDDLIAE